jgi:hypothetical protein
VVQGPRHGYAGRVDHPTSTITLTNASPTDSSTLLAQAYDNNDRVFEFDIACAAGGTDNALRITLADGGTSPHVDLTFPNVAGGAHVRCVWRRGSTLQATATYAPTSAGNAAYVSASVSDTTAIGNIKFLGLQTIKFGATAGQIQVTNLVEIISGAKTTQL